MFTEYHILLEAILHVFPTLYRQITRRDEAMAPFVASSKRNYIFGGICSIAATASIKVRMH